MSVQEPKFLNEFINQFLFDIGEISPLHLQSIRVGLMAYYRRIKMVNIEADLNNNIINVSIKFKWWAVNKGKILRKIYQLFTFNLPSPYKIIGVDDKTGQPKIDQIKYTVNVGRIIFNKVYWLNEKN